MTRKEDKDYEKFHKSTVSHSRIVSKNNFTYRIIFETLNKFLDSPRSILDIGCGSGTVAIYLANKGNKVLGVDVSRNAIKACRESTKILGFNNKNIKFEVMSFPEKTITRRFDLIVCSEVIEHLENDNLALKRMFFLLKKNGIAFISTPSKNAPLYRLGIASSFDNRVGHLRRYSLEELSNKCKVCGFEIIETKKIEGLLRNFLFLNPTAGKLVRFMKFFISDLVTFIDNLLIPLFGESNIIIVVKKP